MLKLLISFILIIYLIIIPFLILFCFEWIIGRSAIKEIISTPEKYHLKYIENIIPVEKGIMLQTWWIPSKSKTSNTILFIHGNKRNISYFCDYFLNMHKELTINIYAISLRGYGKSNGKIDFEKITTDIEKCVNFLNNKYNIPKNKIIVLGRSQGAFIASEYALKNECKALIIESGGTSLNDIVNYYFQKSIIFYPYKFLNLMQIKTNKFNIYNNLKKINIPVLLIHGKNDQKIPIYMAKKNLSANPRANHLWVPFARHNNCYKDKLYFIKINELIKLKD